VTRNDDGSFSVIDTRGLDGTDTVYGVSEFQFSDATLDGDSVLVTPVNDLSIDAHHVAENSVGGTIVGHFSASGGQGPDYTFELVDSNGHVVTDSNFEIVGNTLQVRDGATLDFEASATHELHVRATDSLGITHTEAVTIEVTDVNEAPTDIEVTPLADFEPVLVDGADAGITVVAIRPPGSNENILADAPELHTLSEHHYFDHRSLGYTGYNYMGENGWFREHGIDIRGLRGGQIEFSDGTVGIIDAVSNGAGTHEPAYVYYRAYDDTVDAGVEENAAAGHAVATLRAVDPDVGEQFTYSIESNETFEIVGDTIVVKEGAELDYESTPVHTLDVTVTDRAGHTYTETVTLSVEDVNEAPTDLYLVPDLDDPENLEPGAPAGTRVVGLYKPGSSTNLLDGATDLLTLSGHRYFQHRSLGYTGYNYMGENGWFREHDIDTRGLRGGRIEFADGTVGLIDAVSNGSGSREPAYVYYRAYDPDAEFDVPRDAQTGDIVAHIGSADPDRADTATYQLVGQSNLFELDGHELRIKSSEAFERYHEPTADVTIRVTDSAGNSYDETITIHVEPRAYEGETGTAVAEEAARELGSRVASFDVPFDGGHGGDHLRSSDMSVHDVDSVESRLESVEWMVDSALDTTSSEGGVTFVPFPSMPDITVQTGHGNDRDWAHVDLGAPRVLHDAGHHREITLQPHADTQVEADGPTPEYEPSDAGLATVASSSRLAWLWGMFRAYGGARKDQQIATTVPGRERR